ALTAISYNQKRRNADLKVFEFGKTYAIDGEGYQEKQHLAITISGKMEAEQWNNSKQLVSFYNIKAVVDLILKRLNIGNLQLQDAPTDHYAYGLCYMRGA